MLENNIFSVNQMLFNIRYYFNASEQVQRYLFKEARNVQILQYTIFNIS